MPAIWSRPLSHAAAFENQIISQQIAALILSRGDMTTFVTHPVSALLILVAVVLLVVALLPQVSREREEIFTE